MTQIPKVSQCDMTECGFNRERLCHAAGIQVGDALVSDRSAGPSQDPRCDTFTVQAGARFGAPDLIAQIGACKVTSCVHNDALRCTAEGITVGHHGSHADCLTYSRRA